MSDLVKRLWAQAKFNGDFYCINSFSGYRSVGLDLAGKQYLLPPGARDYEIGEAVFDALRASRFLPLEDAQRFFEPSAVRQRYETWVKNLMDTYGYRARRMLFQNMRTCSVESRTEMIKVHPTNHDRLEGWSGKGIEVSDYILISPDCSSEELGAALRLGFDHCR